MPTSCLAGRAAYPKGIKPDRHNPSAWPCSRWGLPSRFVTKPLVGFYIKQLSCPTFSPLPLRLPRDGGLLSVALSRFFSEPKLASNGGYYPPPCPMEPGLSSSKFPLKRSPFPPPARVFKVVPCQRVSPIGFQSKNRAKETP